MSNDNIKESNSEKNKISNISRSDNKKNNENRLSHRTENLPNNDKQSLQTDSKYNQTNSYNQSEVKLEDIEVAIKINQLKRQEKMQAIDEWIGFCATKVVGTGALLIGGLEFIVPNFLVVTIAAPLTPISLVGFGLSLLAGKKAISLVKNALNGIAKDSTD